MVDVHAQAHDLAASRDILNMHTCGVLYVWLVPPGNTADSGDILEPCTKHGFVVVCSCVNVRNSSSLFGVRKPLFLSISPAKRGRPMRGSLRASSMTLHVGLGSTCFTNSSITWNKWSSGLLYCWIIPSTVGTGNFSMRPSSLDLVCTGSMSLAIAGTQSGFRSSSAKSTGDMYCKICHTKTTK